MKPRAITLGSAALIVGAGIAVYSGSFGGPFVFLDVPAIADNPTIRHLGALGQVLSPPSDGGLTVGGRPVVNLSLAINYAAGGLNVWGYHAVNLAVHLAAALALFGIVRRTLAAGWPDGANPVALLSVLFWELNPAQTESVTYIVQRAESLMGLFYLLTLYCFIRSLRSARGFPWDWLSFLACFLGMATKEVMASAPVLVLLYDRTFAAGTAVAALRRRPIFYSALAATWLPLAALVASTHGRGGTSGFEVNISWPRYVLTQFPAVVRYLQLSIWPSHQSLFYAPLWRPLSDVWPQLLAVVFLAAGCAWAWWKRSPWGYLGAWFFAVLAPTSLIPGVTQTIAEHRLYLALAAVAVAAAVGLWSIARKLRPAHPILIFAGVGAAAVAGLAVATIRRNAIYRSEVALWVDTAEQSPDNPYAQANAGVALAAAGRRPEAMNHFRAAIRLNPRYAEAYNDLGLALAESGELTAAVGQYQAAVRLKPAYPEAEANFGAALAASGQTLEAEAHLRRAVLLNPRSADAGNNLANVLAAEGRLEEAIAEYRQVIRLDPRRAETRFNLGNAYSAQRRWGEAAEQYGVAAGLHPADSDTHANWGVALANLGRWNEAVTEYKRALELAPNDADVRANLQMALSKMRP